ncbi:hypothetical protein GCM10009800_53530 [Nocardiopsis rhodophaea]
MKRSVRPALGAAVFSLVARGSDPVDAAALFARFDARISPGILACARTQNPCWKSCAGGFYRKGERGTADLAGIAAFDKVGDITKRNAPPLQKSRTGLISGLVCMG